jgi:hypothetical protein
MDAHVKDVVREMSEASDKERITFPEVVKALMEAGIEGATTPTSLRVGRPNILPTVTSRRS